MATDGVKIIDGDTAYDTYDGIMDLYDSGATIETIRNKNPFPQVDFYDDFDYEIYTTAYALAIWEIGYMTDDVLQEVKRVIDKCACVKRWTEEYDAKAGKARQKELDRLWTKISSENQKVRKIKKYKTVTNFLFDENDVLVFQLTDENYYAAMLFRINQYRGWCIYEFGRILYKSNKIPTIEDISNAEIIGRIIPAGNVFSIDVDGMMIAKMIEEEGIQEVLKREAVKSGSFVIGIDKIGIGHKDLIDFTGKFQKIGQLNIKATFKDIGSTNLASGFDDFIRAFQDLDNYIKIFKADKFKIANLLEE